MATCSAAPVPALTARSNIGMRIPGVTASVADERECRLLGGKIDRWGRHRKSPPTQSQTRCIRALLPDPTALMTRAVGQRRVDRHLVFDRDGLSRRKAASVDDGGAVVIEWLSLDAQKRPARRCGALRGTYAVCSGAGSSAATTSCALDGPVLAIVARTMTTSPRDAASSRRGQRYTASTVFCSVGRLRTTTRSMFDAEQGGLIARKRRLEDELRAVFNWVVDAKRTGHFAMRVRLESRR